VSNLSAAAAYRRRRPRLMKSPSDVPSASSSVFLCILLFTFRLKTGLEIGVDPADLVL